MESFFMSLTTAELAQLRKIMAIAEKLINGSGTPENGDRLKRGNGFDKSRPSQKGNGPTRIRRNGKELIAFRKMLKAERKAGMAVSEMSKKHGVSKAYIYQLG
jgi:hypothetical protein